ncbi:MAG: GNAT family N-acetyltransferase [Myxococcota bacterium]
MEELIITTLQPEHIDALEALQRIAYPTLHPSHLLRRPHFESHLRLFPEGQHVALLQGKVVGMSATFRTQVDFEHPSHAFNDIIAEGYFTHHDPAGPWLYGADVSVHPDARRKGVASRLYAARKHLIKALNLRGMVAGGMMPSYRFHKATLPVEVYIQKVASGELTDPTLTAQLSNGFQVRGVLHNYLHDELLGDDAALIVWDNPDFQQDSV